MKRIKAKDFFEMDLHERCEKFNTGSMWQKFLSVEKVVDDLYFIFYRGIVVQKIGREIVGIQATDETCSWYERSKNRYINEDGEYCGRSVKEVYNYHYV